MISVDSLSKRFADSEAVRGISFNVEKGEIVGLLGPNGAGKTTTMRMLTCYVPPTSGTAKVAGYDIYEQSVEVRRNIGYLPENVPMYGEMRVDEYLRFRARLKGVPRSAVSARLDYAMGRCGLGDVRRRIIDHLSKGYRQRVGLAETLLHNPPILILDEPTVGLDPNQIRQVRSLIQELGQEHTIILSSHILPEVDQVCGRLVIIHNGRIVAQDRTEVLRQEIGGTARLEIEVKGARDTVLEALGRLPGVISVRETNPANTSTTARLSDHTRTSQSGTPDSPGLSLADPAGPPASMDLLPTAGAAGPAIATGPIHVTVESARDHDLREEIFRLAVARGWVLLGLTRRRMSLEDIFINLTTQDPGAEDGPLPEGSL